MAVDSAGVHGATGPAYATTPFRAGGCTGEWVAAPGTATDGAILYLPVRDEPLGAFASGLSAATGWPVLVPHHRESSAVEDVLAAYRALPDVGFPASRVVLAGHGAGAAPALQALLRLHACGAQLPAAVVAVSPESPASPVSQATPPADVVRLAERAAGLGAAVALERYEGPPHGFPLPGTETGRAVLERIAAFTTEHLAGRPAGDALGALSIERIGWAGYVITSERGTKVVVDPCLTAGEGMHSGIPESPVTVAELADADAVVVTHAGFDHRGDALEIAGAGTALLVCGTALLGQAHAAGIPVERLAPTVSGVQVRCRDVTLRSLPARHESTMVVDGRFVADQPQSFLLTTGEGVRVFCGGDTSLSADLRTWGELYQPHVAVLGIGGLWVGASRVVELPPADAAVAARWLGVSTVLPVHHVPGDAMPAQLAAELAGEPIDVVTLGFGQRWTAKPAG